MRGVSGVSLVPGQDKTDVLAMRAGRKKKRILFLSIFLFLPGSQGRAMSAHIRQGNQRGL